MEEKHMLTKASIFLQMRQNGTAFFVLYKGIWGLLANQYQYSILMIFFFNHDKPVKYRTKSFAKAVGEIVQSKMSNIWHLWINNIFNLQ